MRYVPIFFALPHASAIPLADISVPEIAEITEEEPLPEEENIVEENSEEIAEIEEVPEEDIDDEYVGYKVIKMTEEEMGEFYSHLDFNKYDIAEVKINKITFNSIEYNNYSNKKYTEDDIRACLIEDFSVGTLDFFIEIH